MYAYDKEVLEYFLEHQSQLFDEDVAETLEDADAFLEECMAQVVTSIEDVRDYFEEMDLYGLSDKELVEQAEIFKLPNGCYLIVEG